MLFQFTPLREGRRYGRIYYEIVTYISIHAPPRGATVKYVPIPLDMAISIHAPPRGATYLLGNGVELENISIHAPPRGATGVHHVIPVLYKISIHAPPRGATKQRVRGVAGRAISIHAPPRGATTERCIHELRQKFQFTPLREGRRRYAEIHGHCRYFNSRPSARGDNQGKHQAVRHGYFNSRPSARGDRSWRVTNPAVTRYFNSRPSARGDGKRHAISANLLFNPYKSAWLNNSATQFVEIILVIFHRIIA